MSDCTHYSKGVPPDGRPCGWCAVEKAKEQDAEIERLREKIASMERGVRGAVLGEKYKLVERIEKLEKVRDHNAYNDDGECMTCGSIGDEGHHITDEQIDAAWGWRGEFAARHCPTLFDDVMKELGIERCESPGCDHGLYTEGNDDGSDTVSRACEVCNGHGWVKIGGEDG